MAFVNERPKGSRIDEWLTADRDRNAFLKAGKGLPHGRGSWFRMTWNDETILFGAYEQLNGYVDQNDKAKGLIKRFTIFQLGLPETLRPKEEEVKSMIVEALSEYREMYQYANITQVQVDFAQCAVYQITGNHW